MTHTIAVCVECKTPDDETCKVSFQNKIEKLVHLVGFIIRIRHDARSHVTMHGHMNVKYVCTSFSELLNLLRRFIINIITCCLI
jgi:hypothetical protein